MAEETYDHDQTYVCMQGAVYVGYLPEARMYEFVLICHILVFDC